MFDKRVTVLRGGPSPEFEVSLRTGENVISALQGLYSSVNDIVITKQGEWLQNGIVRHPDTIIPATDMIFIALHGTYGEDGTIQRLIERHNVPYNGSSSLSSAIAFNKHLTKETLSQLGVVMPSHRVVTIADLPNLEEVIDRITNTFGPKYVIKPMASGSSAGVTIANDQAELRRVLTEGLSTTDYLIVEEYVNGREATCAVLDGFRNEPTYVFPVVEIIPPPDQPFFTMKAKYDGSTREICPGDFSYQERTALTDAARLVHEALGLSHYSRSDFIVKNGIPYFLEVNTLPGLTRESLYPKAAASVGLDFSALVKYLVETADV